MRLNHVNLAVTDVGEARTFLERYFGLRSLGVAPEPETIVALSDDSGCIVTLSNFKKSDAVVYPGAFHIGFMQSSREAVDVIQARLNGDGIAVGPCKEFHGAWTFYCKAPGGFTIEVGHQSGMEDVLAA